MGVAAVIGYLAFEYFTRTQPDMQSDNAAVWSALVATAILYGLALINRATNAGERSSSGDSTFNATVFFNLVCRAS